MSGDDRTPTSAPGRRLKEHQNLKAAIRFSLILTPLLVSVAPPGVASDARTLRARGEVPTRARRQAGAADSSPAPAGWKRYGLGELPAFSLILPGEPERLTHDSGAEVMTRVYVSKNDSAVYGASYISDLPAAAGTWAESGSEFLLSTFVKPFAATFRKVVREKGGKLQLRMSKQPEMIVSGGAESLEQYFSFGPFQGRARLFRMGPAGVCAVAVWKGNAPARERAAFFDSIRVAGGPEPSKAGRQ